MKRLRYLLVLALPVVCASLIPGGCESASQRDGRLLPGDHARKMVIDDRERSYILHVPPQVADSAADQPLVIVLHGALTSGWMMQRWLGFDDHADAEGFLVAYPDAAEGGRWNDGRGTLPAPANDFDDVRFVVSMIGDIAAVAPVDLDRVYVTGASNGGMLAYRLGCEASGAFAAIAPVIANIPEPIFAICEPSTPLSVLVINGGDDPLVRLEGGDVCGDLRFGCAGGVVMSFDDSVSRFAEAGGCDGDYTSDMLPAVVDDGTSVERRIHAGCAGDVEVEAYIVHGAGHAWPPGRPALPALGKATGNLDATATVVEFFMRDAAKTR